MSASHSGAEGVTDSGALQPEVGHRPGDRLDLDVEAAGRRRKVLGVVRAVGHHPDPVLQPVDGAVVDHQSVGVAERAVADLPDIETEDVVGVHALGGSQRVGPPELPLVERRDVPYAEVIPNGPVLTVGIAEAIGPEPAALLHEGRPQGGGGLVEGAADRLGFHAITFDLATFRGLPGGCSAWQDAGRGTGWIIGLTVWSFKPRRIPPRSIRAELERSLLPFGQSRMLPRAAYVDPDVFAWEQRHFFDGGWMCVGPQRGPGRARRPAGRIARERRGAPHPGPGRGAPRLRQRVQPPGPRAAAVWRVHPARPGHLPVPLVVVHPRGRRVDGAGLQGAGRTSTRPSTG